MDIEIKTWLFDMLNAIAEIESFFADRPKNFLTYQNDIRTKRAVERNIEIIKALRPVPKPISNLQPAVSMPFYPA